jgi:signal transduction histidine kinase
MGRPARTGQWRMRTPARRATLPAMAELVAMDRLPSTVVARPATGGAGALGRPGAGSAARASKVTAIAVLLLALAGFALGVDGGVPHVLAVLLSSGGWGLSLGLLMSRRRADRDSWTHAAAAAHDERRRVVRDLHDGAQQRLVHMIIVLKLADQAFDADPGSARTLVGEAVEEAQAALRELRQLASGGSPPVLTDGGLAAGVQALAERTPVPVSVDLSAGRLPSDVETAAYFVVAEALTNVAKHAHARTASVTGSLDAGMLRVEIRDDGVGGANPRGTGLAGLRRRVAELDGELEIATSGRGTRVTAAIPLVR